MINRAVLYNKFAKYDVLQTLLNNNPSSKVLSSGPINIFIDIQSVYKDILSMDFIGTDIKTLAINVLNMAAHYRHFFRNRFKSSVCVFLVDSRENLTGNLCGQFNDNSNMFKLVELLCKCNCFPELFYIHRDNVNSCAIIADIAKSMMFTNTFVISNDIYSYQLPIIVDNCFVLRLGTTHKRLVTINNCIDMQFKNSTSSSDLSPKLLPVIAALNKCPELGLPLLYPYKKALNITRELCNKGYLAPLSYNAPTMSLDNVLRVMGFGARWNICDLNTQYLAYHMSPYVLDDTWKIKKQCNFADLAAIIDSKLANDPDNPEDNILNYIYLLE